MFHKILIANRGEIAVRIIQSARKLGIRTVAVYAAIEKQAQHVQIADEAFCLGVSELAETYLNIPKMIEIAQKSGCEAIHPGYGFLSENPSFVQACEANHIIFIGPTSEAIRLMGNKIEARSFVKSIGVPVLEGLTESKENMMAQKESLPYPLLVKAAAGGGGKGMRIVRQATQLEEALTATSREAQAYFGDGSVYIEKYLEAPRHIEFQLLADEHGQIVHLFERECSIQRRYQKIIEEAPSPTLDTALRKQMGEAAVRIGKEIGYTNAGTIEFLLDKDKNFYFLEMNTRVQVEHPVTEMTTGIDIVAEQIKIAAHQPLSFTQEDLQQTGHAIECRVYAESPEDQFLPSPGTIHYYHAPQADDIRLDTAIVGPAVVDSRYDPMIGKLVAYGKSRAEATQKAVDALKEYVIQGISTNIPFLIHLLQTEAFQQNHITTKYCDQHAADLIETMKQAKQALPILPVLAGGLLFDYPQKESASDLVWYQIGFWRHVPIIPISFEGKDSTIQWRKTGAQQYELVYEDQLGTITNVSHHQGVYRFTLNEKSYHCYISENEDGSLNITYEGFYFLFRRNDILGKGNFVIEEADAISDNKLISPMPGKVIKLFVKQGDAVQKGDTILIVEAMKMENNIVAPKDAVIEEVHVAEQDMVDRNKLLIRLA